MPDDCQKIVKQLNTADTLEVFKDAYSAAIVQVAMPAIIYFGLDPNKKQEFDGVKAMREVRDNKKDLRVFFSPSPEVDSAEAEQATPKVRDQRGAGKE